MDLSWSITWADYAQKIIAIFAIVNPFSTIPVFISLTADHTAGERTKVAIVTSASAFTILIVSYFVGEYVLTFFSISVASFRVAGGILILMTAFSMLQARVSATKQTDEEASEARNKENIAIIPLALPLTAGPGAISLMIIASENTKTLIDDVSVAAGLLVIALSICFVLNAGIRLAKALGVNGMNVMTRLMGLILAAIAIEFIVNGLGEKFPGWIS
jgi:multiple antibiotic resistance protein